MANIGTDHKIDLTDDDEDNSFCLQDIPDESILISSDEDNTAVTEDILTSDEELPDVDLRAKKQAILKLFGPKKEPEPKNLNRYKKPEPYQGFPYIKINDSPPQNNLNRTEGFPSTSTGFEKVNNQGVNKMIEGVKINLPVDPYGCQVALMSMLIKAIKGKKNCLLESPTGSGKTLALLCGALGWVTAEKEKLGRANALQYFNDNPELNQGLAAENGRTPKKNSTPSSPEEMFRKNSFGMVGYSRLAVRRDVALVKYMVRVLRGELHHPAVLAALRLRAPNDYLGARRRPAMFEVPKCEKSIYDSPTQGGSMKRAQPMDCDEDSEAGLVTIHKKRKLDDTDDDMLNNPEMDELMSTVEMPERMSVPTIYYGARTHKQLQQVIKEFGRTSYCHTMTMSILSSREHSCIREFDKQMWGTKNDMCRGCIKKIPPKDQNPDTPKKKDETNCKYYDNRKALDRSRLPPAFDLEDLTSAGHDLMACPYFAAREMAQSANIVFCPYNYLIDPSIRSSMRINLQNHIVIIDEAHNIEDICRDSATFAFSRENIQTALKELEHASQYRYSGEDSSNYIEKLIKVLKSWDYWFANQKTLIDNMPVNNNEASYSWQAEHFTKTLQNHDIGRANYYEFHESAEMFCNKLRDEPGSFYGVGQATGTLVGSLDVALGYLFRHDCKYMDDFKPVIVRTLPSDNKWSRYKKEAEEKDKYELRLICLNPGAVFEGLQNCRCTILASGTLTPLISLHSELQAAFPLRISPAHVIPPDRVWIGTLVTHPDGTSLECKSRDTNLPDTQDTIGQAILWVCQVTPNGVLCFVPSYALLNKLVERWESTGVWRQLCAQKHVFQECRNSKDHNDIMEDYYKYVSTDKGALLFAVYRGKVSEGMDFKDQQARAVVTIGVPYPNTYDMAVKAKMEYNDRYSKERSLLNGRDWLKVQAYRALNQAVGRCVRHKGDWGAVLLIDGRFQNPVYTEHLSKWVLKFLATNHHSFESLQNSPNSLESFMQNMTIREAEDLNDFS